MVNVPSNARYEKEIAAPIYRSQQISIIIAQGMLHCASCSGTKVRHLQHSTKGVLHDPSSKKYVWPSTVPSCAQSLEHFTHSREMGLWKLQANIPATVNCMMKNSNIPAYFLVFERKTQMCLASSLITSRPRERYKTPALLFSYSQRTTQRK